jgi:DNA-binding CsgD family transcriptional regulator
MVARYLVIVDDDGRLAKVIPFDSSEAHFEELEGGRLGARIASEEDRGALLEAYGRALVDGERVRCTQPFPGHDGQYLELDIVRFPAVQVSALLMSSVRNSAKRPTLTRRELTVLRLAAEDHTDAAIAKTLRIAKATVSRHKQNIRAKVGVREWAAAVGWAVRNGLL